MKKILLCSLAALLCSVAQTPVASADLIYFQDFQTFPTLAPGTNNPDSWTGPVRAFGGPGAVSVEGGANDIALIAQGAFGYITTRDLGVPVLANTIYTLDLDGGLYAVAAGRSSTVQWELGTINAGTFTPFSSPNSTTLTNEVAGGSYFGDGNEVALAQYSFTTGASVSGDNVAIRLEMIDVNTGFAGFDSISVNAIPIPEPTSLVLFGFGLGLVGFASYRRRCKKEHANNLSSVSAIAVTVS